jgi:integrase
MPIVTFDELAEEYLRWAVRQKSYITKCEYLKALRRHFGGLPLCNFTALLLERFQNTLLDTNRKPATANRYLATLFHMFTKAVGWEMMAPELLARLRTVKLLPENNKRLRFLSRQEADRLLRCSDRRLRPILVTALNTGMRKGEILGLQWEHVDLVHGYILLGQLQTKNSSRREIPINDTLRRVLSSVKKKKGIPWVFYNPSTGRRYGDIKRSFGTACQKAGITDFRFHDLRHTFASWLVMAGADLTTVKELLGHKSLAMTLRYAHLTPGHKLKAIRLLDRRPARCH